MDDAIARLLLTGELGDVLALELDRRFELSRIWAGGPRVFCFRYPTGELVWTKNSSAGGRASMVVEGDLLLVAKGGKIDCYQLDGKWLWTQLLEGHGRGAIAMGVPGTWAQADDGGANAEHAW